MSRVIAWRRFIRVFVEDNTGTPLEAFSFAPTPHTRRMMLRYRLLARAEGSALSLYYRLFPQLTPSLRSAIASRVRFSFTMRLVPQDFFQRHHPDLSATAGASLHLDNLDPSGAILADGAVLTAGATVHGSDAVQIGRRRLPVTVDLAPPPTDVRAVDALAGTQLIDPRPTPPQPVRVPVQASPDATRFTAVLDIPPTEGPLVRVRQTPAGTVDRRAYADDWVAASGAVGVLDLFWESAQDAVPAGAGQGYRIVFARR